MKAFAIDRFGEEGAIRDLPSPGTMTDPLFWWSCRAIQTIPDLHRSRKDPSRDAAVPEQRDPARAASGDAENQNR
jgi:hypothetical protein